MQSIKRLFLVILLIINLLFICLNISNGYSRKNGKELLVQDDFTIQIDDPNLILSEEFVGLIYFGRDTCFECLQVNSILKQCVDEENIIIHKFDTEQWRNTVHYDNIIELYNIESIPTLVIKTDNSIEQLQLTNIPLHEIKERIISFYEENMYEK